LDPKNKVLRSRIQQKISSILKTDYAEEDLKAKQPFTSYALNNNNVPSDAQTEKEFFYDGEWRNFTPGVVWAYMLNNICANDDYSRASLEKNGLPLPKFMPKGTGILESLLLLAFVDLPFGSGKVKVTSNNKLGLLFNAPHNSLIYRDFFKKSEFSLTNTTIVRCNLLSDFKHTTQKYIPEDHVIWTDAVYRCEVVVTNLTAIEQTYQILFQIPEGSISIYDNKTMRYMNLTLPAFQTRSVTSPSYYFPYASLEGKAFNHAPTFVFLDNQVVALSEKRRYVVKSEGTVIFKDPQNKPKTY
jgi:hypothetical protein